MSATATHCSPGTSSEETRRALPWAPQPTSAHLMVRPLAVCCAMALWLVSRSRLPRVFTVERMRARRSMKRDSGEGDDEELGAFMHSCNRHRHFDSKGALKFVTPISCGRTS